MRIEDLDYQKYREVGQFLGFDPKVTEVEFEALRASRPHAFWRKRMLDQWTAQEIAEYENQVAELAERFNYRYRVAELIDEARAEKAESIRLGRIPPPKSAPRLWRARRATAKWLRGLAKSVDVS